MKWCDGPSSSVLQEISKARRDFLTSNSVDCRVVGTWAFNGRSRIDNFSNKDRQAAPYGYAFVETTSGLGCCYADAFLDIPPDWVGRDARLLKSEKPEWEVALIDALPSPYSLKPTYIVEVDAVAHVKAKWRAEVVTNVVRSTITRVGIAKPIVNLGAIGEFVSALTAAGYEVKAADMNPAVVGQSVQGVVVTTFAEVKQHISPGTIVLLTGMSICNGTIDEVLQVARQNEATVIIYAQSGSTFVGEYISLGVECVLSEKFPFYTLDGLSRIHVYGGTPPANLELE